MADALADALGVPPAARADAAMDELCAALRRTLEDQAMRHLTVAEITALARFYNTAEGLSVARKTRSPPRHARCSRRSRRLAQRLGATSAGPSG